MGCHTTLTAELDTRISYPRGLPGCGAASARIGFPLNLVSGSARVANLLTSD